MKSTKDIMYFSNEGKENMLETFKKAKERALELNIKKIFVFTANGEGALVASDECRNDDINVYAVTFPYKQKFYKNKDTKIETGIIDEDIREKLNNKKVQIINGVMPFQDIIIPEAKDVKLSAIINTLSLFGGGMQLCVEAIIMAFEQGFIEKREEVIACSADTAIVATGSYKRLMFSPYEGMEIKEIICKPRDLTITRNKVYSEDEK